MKKFEELGLAEPIVRVLRELNFKEPSDIQKRAIPLAIAGKDIIGGSATGSGKTLVFGVAIVGKLRLGDGLRALILTPTRELAEQVSRSLMTFAKYSPLKIISVYGGVGIDYQIKQLRIADVVVGTPGRILDHIERGTIDLSRIKILVLDEADRMLDMGFLPDVESIIRKCQRKRQTMLFSATIPSDIASLANRYMNEPVKVSVVSYVDKSKLKQVFYNVPQRMKFSLLTYFLKKEKSKLAMIFCNTRQNADFVGKHLRQQGINVVTTHGGLTQNRRNKIMEDFHKGRAYVLVCTDVAARGLDIPDVSHIYNYDIPKTSKEYIHRIGRTARAGKEGIAINILSERDHENFRRVLEDRSLAIEEQRLPDFPTVKLNLYSAGEGGHRFSGPRHGDSQGRSFGRRHERGARGERHIPQFGAARSSGSRSFGGRRSSR